MRYTFIGEHKDFRTDQLVSKVTIETEHMCLDEIIEEFENFLKGCGFSLDGRHIEVVEDES